MSEPLAVTEAQQAAVSLPPVFRWEQGTDGVVTVTIDDPTARVNTVSDAYVRDLGLTVDRLEAEVASIAGVIIQSGKSSFLAGGNLNKLTQIEPAEKQAFIDSINHRKGLLRRLELLRTPVVAIINGPALGGGLELAMACHHRVLIDDGRAMVGLPEVGLGLMPGAGGVIRVARRFGVAPALEQLILTGRRLSPSEAVDFGLIEELAPTKEEANAAAREWILAHPHWESPYPSGPLEAAPVFPTPPLTADPAQFLVTQVALSAVQTDIDTAFAAETDAFAELVVGAPAKMSIQTVFFDTTALRNDAKLRGEPQTELPSLCFHSEDSYALAVSSRWAVIADLIPPGQAEEADLAALHIGGDGFAAKQAWLPLDAVGDGQLLLEYVDDECAETSNAVATLAKRGVLPLGLGTAGQSFSLAAAAAFTAAAEELRQQGASTTDLTTAVIWAKAEAQFPELTNGAAPFTPTAESERLAHSLLTTVATAMQAFATNGGLRRPEELNAASVRFGGFPAWTGGAQRWLTERSHHVAR